MKGKKVPIDKSNIKLIFTYIQVMEHFKKHEINKSGCAKKMCHEFYFIQHLFHDKAKYKPDLPNFFNLTIKKF